jgi:integrase
VPGRDTKTRFQGVFARHQERCRVNETGSAKDCNCTPSYYGVVWDRATQRTRKTRRCRTVTAAKHARDDLAERLRSGEMLSQAAGPRLRDAKTKFLKAVEEGVVLNKHGRPYKPKAAKSLRTSLNRVPNSLARRRLGDIRRGDVQGLVDELRGAGVSGSRVRNVVNALRSLYRWAQDRDLTGHDPAQHVRLPAMDAKPRDRIAAPPEFATLLDRIKLDDALPFGLAGYGSARHQEIQILDWAHVDLKLGAIELAADEEGRKPGGSWRVVPIVKPLRIMLRRAWIAQGRPSTGKVCGPRHQSKSGLLSLGYLQQRVHKLWRDMGLEPIGLHEARHTMATWLDHAGVSPKVASEIMGHKTPEYQPGAAAITLRRYTHTLPGQLERARDQLDAFIAEWMARAATEEG